MNLSRVKRLIRPNGELLADSKKRPHLLKSYFLLNPAPDKQKRRRNGQGIFLRTPEPKKSSGKVHSAAPALAKNKKQDLIIGRLLKNSFSHALPRPFPINKKPFPDRHNGYFFALKHDLFFCLFCED